MFVATAVMRLVESDRLTLADEVRGHLPPAPAGTTIGQLLNHTSGLPDYAAAPEYLAAVDDRPARPWDLAEIIRVGLAGDRSAPGVFRYSNLGYWMLGAVVEEITGTSLDRALDDLVFMPAGMASTCYPRVGTLLTEDGYDTRWAGPAGAVWSTPEDVTLFLSRLLDASLVAQPTLAAMRDAVPVVAGAPWRRPGYGMGLMVDHGHHTLGHGGGGPGYLSAAFTAFDAGRSVAVVARSSTDVNPTETALRLLKVLA